MHSYFRFALGVILFLLLGYLAVHYLTTLFLPFLIALILASMIEPIVIFLERKLKLKRDLAVGITLFNVIGLLVIILVLVILRLYSELLSLSSLLPQYYSRVVNDITNLLSQLEYFYLHLPAPVVEVVQNNIAKFYLALENLLKAFLAPLAGLPSLITILLISAIATYFISKDRKIILQFCWSLLPKNWQIRTRRAINEVVMSVIAFAKAQIILVSITTCITIIGLSVLRIDYALVIGVLTGLFDFLPILGPSTIFLPWIGYTFFFLNDYGLGIGLTVIYLLLMTIRQIAEPKIVGAAVGLHPLASLMAMYVGIKLLGVMGFIIGPLTLVTLKAAIRAGLIPKLPRE